MAMKLLSLACLARNQYHAFRLTAICSLSIYELRLATRHFCCIQLNNGSVQTRPTTFVVILNSLHSTNTTPGRTESPHSCRYSCNRLWLLSTVMMLYNNCSQHQRGDTLLNRDAMYLLQTQALAYQQHSEGFNQGKAKPENGQLSVWPSQRLSLLPRA